MKVYVITGNSWNGEYDVISNTGEAFANKDKAQEVVNERNKTRGKSSYATFYDYEEVEVQ